MDENIKKRDSETPTLSTGQPSTLGVWRDNCKAFGLMKAAAYFEDKIYAEGEDEPVLADESQVMVIVRELERRK